MLKSYLKIAYRNLLRHRAYSLINIVGLAVGLSCTILISLFVVGELRYDRHHEKSDYYIASRWLESFAYRIDLGAELFLLGGGMTLVAALLAAGSEAVNASLANVVDGLRYE